MTGDNQKAMFRVCPIGWDNDILDVLRGQSDKIGVVVRLVTVSCVHIEEGGCLTLQWTASACAAALGPKDHHHCSC